MRSVTAYFHFVIGPALMVLAQNGTSYAPATEMPSDRVADSYAVYEWVLPSNAIEWSEAQRTQWLMQDETTAKALAVACDAAQMSDLPQAVVAPAERKAEWDEVLQDYAAHCHDRYRLSGTLLHTNLRVHLLDQEAQKRYWQGVSGLVRANSIMQAPPTPDEFKGAAGLHSFSAVYFNRSHTLAATYFGMGCGSTCGNWTWVVLEKTGSGWRRLPWVTVVTMS